ncbi:ABC transporter ATP-binding protein [Salinarimonas soli]|uniref:ABC transporter ATP-binding protein n=1 Tax=Salinarimonas soli TaxID=1638099 RepID=UPI001661B95E|nr:ABC transporter ATP-binding protein [Salinarimonas soli]
MKDLSLADLRLAYGSVTALDGVSLEIAPGELVALVGPSGCGKSSLLAAAAGLVDLDGGRVSIGGRDVTGLEPGERNVSVVFQGLALYPTMSAARNVTFGMRMRGVPRAEAQARLIEAARLLRIEDILDRRPAQLSGGQRQRVAIARALVRDPDAFLFDEPLSSLDAALRADLRDEIRRVHARTQACALYVTHDQAEAMALGDRLAVMRAGRILQVGTPREVYNRPQTAFVAGFVGAPRMNLVPARLVAEAGVPALELGDHRLPLPGYAWSEPPEPGRPVVLGLRAEDIGRPRLGSHSLGAMRVVSLEPTGADTLARLAWGEAAIVARLERDPGVGAGDLVEIAADLSRASLFCPRTERRL